MSFVSVSQNDLMGHLSMRIAAQQCLGINILVMFGKTKSFGLKSLCQYLALCYVCDITSS